MYWDGERWLPESGRASAQPTSTPRRRLRDWLSTGVMIAALVALIVPVSGAMAAKPPAKKLIAEWSSTSSVEIVQESNSRIDYGGKWTNAYYTGYLGGKAKATKTKGARAALRFSGAAVSWVGPVGPTRGKATVYIDGNAVATVNSYASEFKAARVLFQKSWSKVGTHRIKIVALGTAGHPMVALDAFVVRLDLGDPVPVDDAGSPIPTLPPDSPAPTAAPGATPAPTATPKPTPAPTATPTPAPTATPAPSTGRTLYMSPSGSDSSTGLSPSSPFKSLRSRTGSLALQPGDTVLVRGGTYTDPSGAGSTWTPTVSGTATAPITIKAYPGETPVFDGGQAVGQSFVLLGNSYLTFEGLSFTRYAPYGNGMFIVSASSHIRLLNVRIYNSPGSNRWQDHYLYIASGSADVIVDGARFDGATGAAVQVGGGNGTASTGVVVRNSRLSNSGWGIISTVASGAVYKNNVIDGNAVALRVAGSSSTTTTITSSTIRGSVGISVSPLPPSQTILEGSNCLSATVAFQDYGAPADLTYAQWQAATGQGAGDTIGTCP